MTTATVEPMALNITNTARALNCSRQHVYGLIRDGRLRVVRLGNAPRVPMAEIERLLAGHEAS